MKNGTARNGASFATAVLLTFSLWVPAVSSDNEISSLPNGTAIAVSIDTPADGAVIQIPGGGSSVDVPVEGTASVGEEEPDATVIIVVDVSGSTVQDPGSGGGDCGGDVDGDTFANTILDCEIAGALAVRAQLAGAADEFGYVVFGLGGAAADMTPPPGLSDDPLTHPDADLDGMNGNDADTVIESTFSCTGNMPPVPAGVTEFMLKDVGCNGTDYSQGLSALLSPLGSSSNGFNLVLFLSDGFANTNGADFDAQLAAVAATGAQVETFAVGDPGVVECDPVGDNPAGELHEISDATGGDCENVNTPSDLLAELPEEVGATLESLSIEVNGGGSVPIDNSEIDPDLPQEGPAMVSYATSVNLGAGTHEICVTAAGMDAGGPGSVTDCHTVHVNTPPDCSAASADPPTLWPPNHLFRTIQIVGVTDADGDPATLVVTSIRQDEPTDTTGDGAFAPDGQGVGSDTAEVRAERVGDPMNPGNGRVYHIGFTASDDQGGSCDGDVTVGVPHDMKGTAPIDDGPIYDSTV